MMAMMFTFVDIKYWLIDVIILQCSCFCHVAAYVIFVRYGNFPAGGPLTSLTWTSARLPRRCVPRGAGEGWQKRVGSFWMALCCCFRTRFVLSCRKESKNTILMFVLSLMLEENSILTELHLVARVWLELCTISALSYGLMQKLYLLMHSTEVRKLELLLSWSCRKWKPRTGLVRPSRPLRHPMR